LLSFFFVVAGKLWWTWFLLIYNFFLKETGGAFPYSALLKMNKNVSAQNRRGTKENKWEHKRKTTN
jgi:hypothetical protein